jgi:hypothetical protein
MPDQEQFIPQDQQPATPVSPGVGALLGALAAGGLSYAALRRRTLSSDPRLRAIQLASQGKFTRVLNTKGPQGSGPLAYLRRLATRLAWAGGGDVIHRPGMNKLPMGAPEKIKGAVRHYTRSGDLHLSGDVNLSANEAARKAYNLIDNNKWKEYQIFNKALPGAMGRSEHLPDLLKQIGYAKVPTDMRGQQRMLQQLEAHIRKNYPKGFFLKDVHSANTGGRFPTDKSSFVELLQQARQNPADNQGAQRVIRKLLKDPSSAMVQERLPLQEGSRLGKLWARLRGDDPMSTKEVRVHVINGVVMPQMTVPRFDQMMKFTGRHQLRGASRYAQKAVDRLPGHLRNATFAMDVAPIKGGGYKIIESNPSGVSGLTNPKWNSTIGLQMHKAFTGQHSRPVAALGATAAGLAGAGVAHQALSPSSEESPKQAMYTFRAARG